MATFGATTAPTHSPIRSDTLDRSVHPTEIAGLTPRFFQDNPFASDKVHQSLITGEDEISVRDAFDLYHTIFSQVQRENQQLTQRIAQFRGQYTQHLDQQVAQLKAHHTQQLAQRSQQIKAQYQLHLSQENTRIQQTLSRLKQGFEAKVSECGEVNRALNAKMTGLKERLDKDTIQRRIRALESKIQELTSKLRQNQTDQHREETLRLKKVIDAQTLAYQDLQRKNERLEEDRYRLLLNLTEREFETRAPSFNPEDADKMKRVLASISKQLQDYISSKELRV